MWTKRISYRRVFCCPGVIAFCILASKWWDSRDVRGQQALINVEPPGSPTTGRIANQLVSGTVLPIVPGNLSWVANHHSVRLEESKELFVTFTIQESSKSGSMRRISS